MDPGPISIILLSPVYFTRTVYFTRILYCFPLDTLITFVSSKPVRLTTSSQVGNKVLGCVVCRFRIAASKQSLDEAPYINCPKLSQLASITFSCLALLSKNDKPWFLNWGKTSCYTHHTFLLGFTTGWSFTTHKDCCWGTKKNNLLRQLAIKDHMCSPSANALLRYFIKRSTLITSWRGLTQQIS
jgi:hypothetical protein